MLSTIDFDDEPMFLTNEIYEVRADGHLAPEAETIEAMRSQF